MKINNSRISFRDIEEKTKSYKETEKRLRHTIYGYHNSLDSVISKSLLNFNILEADTFTTLESFANEVEKYFVLYCDEHNKMNLSQYSSITKHMMVCMVHFLATECNYSDYTFLSLIKLLDTFEGTLSNQEQDKELNTSTFYIMYSDIKGKILPVEIKSSYDYIFSENIYSFELYDKIAPITRQAISMYLYIHNLDFTRDESLMNMSEEIIAETIERLKTIQRAKNLQIYHSSDRKRPYRRRTYEQSE